MNPTAQEFIPRKKRTEDSLYSLYPQQPGPYPQQPPPPPPPQQTTKLRASAPAFVPKTAAPPPTMSSTSALQPPVAAPSSSPAFQQQLPRHVDPTVLSGSETQQLPGVKQFVLNAPPYTPANPKVAARFSPVPQTSSSTASVTDAPQGSKPHEEQEVSSSTEKHETPKRTEQTESAPREPSAVSTPVAEEKNNNKDNKDNKGDDKNNTVPSQIDVIGDAVRNDFSGSALPSVFEVKDLARPPPSEPLRFNTVWALYADDHPTPFGALLAYDPVLVHLVGDMECFWRLWRYLPPPSALVPAFTYHWFRRDIKPNWEHARNKNGGTITIVIFDRDKPGQNSKQTMDDAFMTMLMACCGETLAESPTNLNGVMLKVRQNKPTTLQLWTASSDQRKLKALAASLRTLLEKVIGAKPIQKLEYFSHQQTQVGGPGSLAGRMKGKPTRITPDFTL